MRRACGKSCNDGCAFGRGVAADRSVARNRLELYCVGRILGRNDHPFQRVRPGNEKADHVFADQYGDRQLETVPDGADLRPVHGQPGADGEIFLRILLEFHPEGFFDGSLYTLGLDRPNFILAVVCILVLWCVAMLQERGSVRERIAGSNIVFRWMIYYIAIFAVLIFGIYGPGYDAASFIYMNF